tara:strand:+ start:302 stop:499 length:198 start_codon:yes stop_codon:yes gene_type:complete
VEIQVKQDNKGQKVQVEGTVLLVHLEQMDRTVHQGLMVLMERQGQMVLQDQRVHPELRVILVIMV